MDKFVEYCLYVLIFFIPISKAGVEIFASLAISAFIIKKILQPELRFIKNHTHLFLLFFVIFGGLSLLNSGPYLKKSLEALFCKWLEYIFIFLIVEDTLASHKRLRNAMAILLIVGAIVGIDGLFQRFLGWDFLRQRLTIKIREGMFAVTGPFKHYNDFAAYLVCVLSLFVALFLGAGGGQVGLVFAIVLLGMCLLFTFSRGGWLGFLAGGLLMLFLLRQWKVVLTVITIFALALILVPAIKERTVFTFRPGGDAGRFVMWQGTWRIIKENPFLGKGLGTFMEYFPRYIHGLGIQYAHNCYLQMWAEIGIFGLLSFVLFVGSILLRGIRVFRAKRDFFLLGVLCGIFGFLVHSFFDTQLYSLQLSVLFWFMLGLAVSMVAHSS